MPSNPYIKWGGILGLLLLANIVNYFYNYWGLITVHAADEPLSQIIRSIEWQGWVKIYTNLPVDQKVTMYVDHVPLAEAMETLAANVSGPPPGDGGGNDRPRRGGGAASFGNTNGPGGAPPSFGPGGGPPAGGPGGAQPSFGPGGGPPAGGPDSGTPPGGAGGNGFAGGARGGGGGFGGGRGGGGFGGGGRGGGLGGGGGGAQWNLAFFVAPTPADVKAEIHSFEANETDDDTKVYTYGTQLQMVTADSDAPAADPRLQAWPGIKPVDPSQPPAPAPAPVADASAGNGPTPQAADPLPLAQTYLQAFAQSADIWIMAPSSWAPAVSSPPPPSSSIIRAIKNFVTGSHGAVTEAIILRMGRGGNRGGGGGGPGGDTAWADRMRNAINGLPPDARPDALAQLNDEIKFRSDLQALPPQQRFQKMAQHMIEKMLYSERMDRMNPVKRAKMYQRMVAARAAARGKT